MTAQQQQQLMAAQQLSLGVSNQALSNSYMLNSAGAPAQDQFFSGLQPPTSKCSNLPLSCLVDRRTVAASNLISLCVVLKTMEMDRRQDAVKPRREAKQRNCIDRIELLATRARPVRHHFVLGRAQRPAN